MSGLTRLPQRTHRSRAVCERGFSLVELMVALTLGLAVLVGVSSVYVAVKQSFRFQETTGRMVEDGNYALDVLTRDLRMAGFAGCRGISSTTVGTTTTYMPASVLSDQARGGIEGPNPLAVLFSGDSTVTAQPLTPNNFLRGFDSITTGKGRDMFTTVPAVGNAGPSSAIFFAGGSQNIVTLAAASTGTGTDDLSITDDAFKWGSTTSGASTYDFVISDCNTSALFRGKANTSAKTVSHGSALGNSTTTPLPAFTKGAQLMPLEWRLYYIATRRGADTPSLYVVRYNGNERLTAEEVVSNVEAMQIHYGEDITPAASPPASAPTSAASSATTSNPLLLTWRKTAASVGTTPGVVDWSRVKALRIGLMMVSATDNADNSITQPAQTLLGENYTIPTGASSNRLRREFSTTVLLRNRSQ